MDAAPYINDARAGQLILRGGVTGRDQPGYHDWENILRDLGWLQYDHTIAGIVNGRRPYDHVVYLGCLCALLAVQEPRQAVLTNAIVRPSHSSSRL